jgi:hypothetical protein
MPTTYRRCDETVIQLSAEILCKYESHKPLLDARVAIDYLFALPDLDEDGQPMNDALKKNGVKALGLTRKLGLKDRACGRGDAYILLDHWWWTQTASEEMQRALLDHELHHVAVVTQKETGVARREEDGRPKIRLRKHDFEFGFFTVIAARHGEHSLERMQAREIVERAGQFYFPEFVK